MKRAPSKKSSSASHAKRKRAAAPRRTESDKFKHIVQHAIEGIFQSTLTGKLLTANPSFVAMLGYASIAELKHQPLTKIFYNPDDRNLLTNALASTGHVRNFELKLKRKDGSPIYVIENSRLIKDRKGKPQYIEGMIIDITSRKQIEEQLRAAEKKYQSIFNNAVEGIYQSTPDGTLFTANKAFLAMLGYESIEELERSDVTQLYVDPSARAAFREIVDREGVITDYELQLRRKDGRIITTLINSRAVRDEIGTTLYYEGIIQDITRRKMQEEQLRVLNAQKDKFLGIVSHDLRAPFNSILGFSELMLDDVNPPSAEEQKEFIRFINEAAKQQLLLLTNLLDWSRFETGRMRFSFKPVNLAEIVGKCIITLFGNAKKKQLSLVCDVPPSVTVYGDEYLLQQLFTNLISNALKFTPPGGSVRVQTHGVENHLLTVSVTDTGIGISPENIDKLFRIETKHTTRGTEGEEGSGLGLVLCAEIVEKHGGTIHAESVETKGTSIVFTLLLPRRTVVIAEDDKGDRLLIAQYIKQLYPDLSIIEAVDGEAAFSSIVQHLPCLVIADYVMPGMDGIRLIKELHKHPHTKGIPVVSMTSVQSQGSAAELRAAGAREVLMKPITKAE
ncbi:MAG: PAS domain S-box protein, partial [Bacteroidetes bacterium]